MPKHRRVDAHRDQLGATLFRLGGNRDGQLLLALHVALSEAQRRAARGEPVRRPSIWRPTDLAADYLRARLLFRIDEAA
jgi:hypothetical protein